MAVGAWVAFVCRPLEDGLAGSLRAIDLLLAVRWFSSGTVTHPLCYFKDCRRGHAEELRSTGRKGKLMCTVVPHR